MRVMVLDASAKIDESPPPPPLPLPLTLREVEPPRPDAGGAAGEGHRLRCLPDGSNRS